MLNDKRALEKILLHYGYNITARRFKIICPFHEDVNPSLLVDLDENFWFCFGCNEGGTGYNFLKKLKKNIKNDLQLLRLYVKILIDNTDIAKYEVIKKKEKQYEDSKDTKNDEALLAALDYYSNLPEINWNKISLKNEVKKYMLERGFTSSALNLAKAKLTTNSSYKIIFPIFDLNEFKGWVCRTIDAEIEKKRKYLYNKGFSRKTTLLGNYNYHTVIVTEGFFDWLKFRISGFTKVTAFFGWKATKEQIKKLKDAGVKNIISALDNDLYGEKGTDYLKAYFNVYRLNFPKGIKDPGEMNKSQILKIVKESEFNELVE